MNIVRKFIALCAFVALSTVAGIACSNLQNGAAAQNTAQVKSFCSTCGCSVHPDAGDKKGKMYCKKCGAKTKAQCKCVKKHENEDVFCQTCGNLESECTCH